MCLKLVNHGEYSCVLAVFIDGTFGTQMDRYRVSLHASQQVPIVFIEWSDCRALTAEADVTGFGATQNHARQFWIINQTILLFLVLDTAKTTSLHLLWSELILDRNCSRPQPRKTITKIVNPSWSIQLASAYWWVSLLILWTNVCPSWLWWRDHSQGWVTFGWRHLPRRIMLQGNDGR